MGYANELGMMVDFRPDEARAKIVAAFREVQANRAALATHFDVDRTTLWRWIAKLDLDHALKTIEKKAIKEGWRKDERKVGGDGPTKRTKSAPPLPSRKKTAKKTKRRKET